MKHLAVICLASVVLALAPRGAQAATVGPHDSQAEEILKRVSDFYAAVSNFSVDAETHVNISASGMKQEMTVVSAVAMERPNRLAITFKSGFESSAMSIISDGSKQFVYVPRMSRYVKSPAAASLDELLESADGMMVNQAIPVLADLMSTNPAGLLMTDVASNQYVGAATLNGVSCEQVRFFQKQFDWDMWVETGKTPVVHQIVVDPSKSMIAAKGSPGQPAGMRMETRILFADWQLDRGIPASRFQFTPPAGVQEVSSLDAGDEEEGASNPLVGKPAPDFELALLDGGNAKLAGHKDIVILDFWATWCGPCRRTLPIVAQVARKYQDKGVRFYAVNEREDGDKIKAFLKQQKITCAVALDRDGKVGDLYGVEGIPQTVVIGKDGTVQQVDVGFTEDLQDTLTKDLDALLAGKSLVGPASSNEVETTAEPAPATK